MVAASLAVSFSHICLNVCEVFVCAAAETSQINLLVNVSSAFAPWGLEQRWGVGGTLVKIASKPQGWGRRAGYGTSTRRRRTPCTLQNRPIYLCGIPEQSCSVTSSLHSQADMRNSASYINSTWGDLSLATDSCVCQDTCTDHSGQSTMIRKTLVLLERVIKQLSWNTVSIDQKKWLLWSPARFISADVINYSLNHRGVSPIHHEEVFLSGVLGSKSEHQFVCQISLTKYSAVGHERGPVCLFISNGY